MSCGDARAPFASFLQRPGRETAIASLQHGMHVVCSPEEWPGVRALLVAEIPTRRDAWVRRANYEIDRLDRAAWALAHPEDPRSADVLAQCQRSCTGMIPDVGCSYTAAWTEALSLNGVT